MRTVRGRAVLESLVGLLARSELADWASSARPVERHGHLYTDLFVITHPTHGDLFVKIRRADEAHIGRSLQSLADIRDREGLVEKHIHVERVGDRYIIATRRVLGSYIEGEKRSELPRFFGALARFNTENRSRGPFTSMYADGRLFQSVDELIEHEIAEHFRWVGAIDLRLLREALGALGSGFGCVIQEDTNVGNMILTTDGEPTFLDTEWIHASANLYQFDHMNPFGISEAAWFNITEEAQECYAAYFDALGESRLKANDQIRGIELLSALRANTYRTYCGSDDGGKTLKAHIDTVLSARDVV
ncbi:MAG: hypothetical protein MI724_20055 [Spirochaetales bacterium]|nr:hypothetical protein [Spirochaetales bacterium]